MPRYHFKLVDGNIVSDHGTHELDDETMAQIEAVKLARSLRRRVQNFPERIMFFSSLTREARWCVRFRLMSINRGPEHPANQAAPYEKRRVGQGIELRELHVRAALAQQ
jgi:hypothetical protein